MVQRLGLQTDSSFGSISDHNGLLPTGVSTFYLYLNKDSLDKIKATLSCHDIDIYELTEKIKFGWNIWLKL